MALFIFLPHPSCPIKENGPRHRWLQCVLELCGSDGCGDAWSSAIPQFAITMKTLLCCTGGGGDQTRQENLVGRNQLCLRGWSALVVQHLCSWLYVSDTVLSTGTRQQWDPPEQTTDGMCPSAPEVRWG